MVMLKDQMFRRRPTMFAGGTPNRINDPRTAIGVAQGGGLNAPTQTSGGAFGGMLPPVSMPVSAPIDYSQGGGGYMGIQGGFDDFGNINGSGAANAAREQYYSNTGFNTTLPTQAPVAAAQPYGATGFNTTLPTQAPVGSTVFNPVAPAAGSAPSSGNVGAVTGGAVLGGLLTGNLGDALRGAGEYYLGQEGVEGAYQTGVTGLEMAQQLGQQAAEAAQFKPYTVTSNLARVGTDPSGGFTTQLSPEQQALQNQIMGQAGGFFNQLQADPAAVQAGIYEDIRATQRPEEERQRLALEERMLSQGRLGLSSAAYGGASPELLAMETARQEAMARANVGARQQALAEQAQTASLAGGLLSSGYMPQQQALSLLEASQIPAGMQQTGQLSGVELQSQLGGRGIESYMQGADLANRLQLQQQQGLMSTVLGKQPTVQEQLINRIIGGQNAAPLTGSGGFLGSILDYFNKDKSSSPSASASQLMFADNMGLTPEQLLAGISGPSEEDYLANLDLSDY
jgi:hypothetical protein